MKVIFFCLAIIIMIACTKEKIEYNVDLPAIGKATLIFHEGHKMFIQSKNGIELGIWTGQYTKGDTVYFIVYQHLFGFKNDNGTLKQIEVKENVWEQ